MKNSGPFKAFKMVGFLLGEEGVPEMTINASTQVIEQIMIVFNSAHVELERAQNEIMGLDGLQKLIKDCEGVLGRQLGVVDIEHALCKISRENSDVKKTYDDALKAEKAKATEAKDKPAPKRARGGGGQ